MTGKIDWRRARKFSGAETKYDDGTELRNGTVVVKPPQDDLEKRARQAERGWLRERGDLKR